MPVPVVPVERSGHRCWVFDLTDVYYNEGAPEAWRTWLLPGTPVALRFAEEALTVFGAHDKVMLRYDELSHIDVRGSDRPERVKIGGSGLAGLIAAVIVNARSGFSRCWLAFGLLAGGEILFEVENLLRDDLERLLDEHSG